MTAEVAILNRQAVALAADSAVTINGPYGQKIFNTVNKLFALSKYYPVGIMVYSSAEIMGVPVETVIKVFRRNLGSTSFATLEEYGTAFITFLTEDDSFFSENARLEYCRNVVNAVVSKIYQSIQWDLIRRYPGWKQPTEDEARDTARAKLHGRRDYYQSSADLPGVTNDIRERLKQETLPIVDFWRGRLKDEFTLSELDTQAIEDIALGTILKEARNDIETGFAITGFGESEIFPHLRSFEFEASIYGIHKLFLGQSADATENAQVVPFAQTEMVETFVYGRALSLDTFLEHFIREFFEGEKTAVHQNPQTQQDAVTICQFLDDMGDKLVNQFNHRLGEFTLNRHALPLMETVAAMPKEELAVMAEALINLTSIKRRMSPDMETVGGPTDVAVISKGDGFIWIKRKHYFDGELNKQFGYNYNREDTRRENE